MSTTVVGEPIHQEATASIAPPTPADFTSEEEDSFIVTRLFYTWLSPLISRCADAHSEGRSITPNDLLSVPRDEHIDIVYEQTFLPIWKAELENPTDPQVGPSLKTALRKSFGFHCFVGLFCKVLADAGVVGVPLMLRSQLSWIVDYAVNPSSKSGHEWEGYIWSLGLAVLVIVSSFFQNASAYFTAKAFMKMRTATMLALFDKATTLPGSHGLSGRVTQMHGTDASKFIETAMFVQNIFTALPMLIGAIIALYFFIGPAAFIGLLVAVVTVPPQGYAARMNGMERAFAARHGDKRINKVNEFVQGIRIIKFMSWEDQFEKTTEDARQREVDHFFVMHKYRAIFVSILTYAPMVMAFATFACAYAFGSSMQAQDVFPAFAMLNVLRAPLTIMPLAGAKLVELLVVLGRANAFLVSDEQVSYTQNVDVIEGKPNAAIYIPHAVIQYDTDSVPMSASATPGQMLAKPQFDGQPGQAPGAPADAAGATQMEAKTKRLATLMTLNEFEIPKGELTVVIGATASGKSVLISTIVGENMVTDDSVVLRAGTLAYVAQEAWIMNETLKNNVLMGKEYDEVMYKRALLSCQLKSDMEQLPGSDATEIGERGINLSGGQKQRVAFARAVYSNRDIVLMDDPLSAVDPHVCGALFHGCIRGALAGKTRVLVTHQQQFLRWADRVILVAGLEIIFNGTYEELMKRQDLKEHMSAAKKKPTNDSFGASFGSGKDIQRQIEQEDPEVVAAREAAHEAALEKELLEGDKVANRDFAADALLWTVPLPQQAEAKKVDTAVVTTAAAPAAAGGDTKGTSLMSKEEVKSDDGFFIYIWYCKQAGWPFMLATWFGYITWRIASGFADYMVTWWATRAKPFDKYKMTQDEYCYWYFILIFIVGLLVTTRMIPFVLGTINASRTVHGSMINRLLHAPMSFYDTTPAGRILNRAGKDMEMLDVVIPEGLSVFYNLILVVLGAWVVQAIAAWFMPIVYVIVMILFVFLFRGYVIANHDVKALDAVMRSPVLSIMNETLGGLATLRAYGMIESYRRNHANRLHNMNRATYASRNLQRWLGIRTDFLTGLVIMSVGMICEGMLQNMSASDRASNLPSISLALTYVVMVSSAIGFLCTTLADLMAAFSSAERVKEYAETLPQERVLEYTDGPATLDSNNVALTAPRPPENWPAYGSVEFDHVFLRYRPGLDLVLTDVSFSVKSGEKVGVVGRTGSGKSTIMLSLFRMIETAHDTHPVANRILIDGIDISHVKLEDVRTKVTIIPQDPLLFQGTVRSNLDPFNGHADDEIWAVLEKAKMRERVEREDLGLECSVADRGANFSAGERQLLCLARALLKNCKILLLDEATASIDPKHDQIVQDTIRREFADRTVLTIAHRLGTIIDSDKVLVLDAGRVLEFGYPHELLQKEGGQFRSMVHELGPEEEHRLRDVAKHAYDKSIERAKHHSAPY